MGRTTSFKQDIRTALAIGQTLIFVRTPEPHETLNELCSFAAGGAMPLRILKRNPVLRFSEYVGLDSTTGSATTEKSGHIEWQSWEPKATPGAPGLPGITPPPNFVTDLSRWHDYLADYESRNRTAAVAGVLYVIEGADAVFSKENSVGANPHAALVERARISSYLAGLEQKQMQHNRQENEDSEIVIPKIAIIFLATELNLPPQIMQPLTSVIDYPLPTREEIRKIAQELTEPVAPGSVIYRGLPKTDEEQEQLFAAATGLNRSEAEYALARSTVDSPDGVMSAKIVMEHKSRLVSEKCPSLQVTQPEMRLSSVGGADYLKKFVKKSGRTLLDDDSLKRPRGVFLCGVPGTGKSLLAKATAAALKIPLVRADLGANLGKYVGESNSNQRNMFRCIEAMSPCVLWLDEIEKSLGGGSDGNSVRTELLGDMLTWLQERTESFYLFATCNDVGAIQEHHPELLRAGRFDASFFLDFPSYEAQLQIWACHLKRYQFVTDKKLPTETAQLEELLTKFDLPDASERTGAEIEQCVRFARMLEVPFEEAMRKVSKIKDQAAGLIDRLRKFAHGRFLDPETGEIYSVDSPANSRQQARSVLQGMTKRSRRISHTEGGSKKPKPPVEDDGTEE